MRTLSLLRQRNRLLFDSGMLWLFGAVVCSIMIFNTDLQVLGINAWIKPMKFYLSLWIFSWSMGWFLHELDNQRAVHRYSIMLIIVFAIEMAVITWQAANGRLSHFNVSSPLYGILFSIMGIAITVMGIWTALIAVRFFKQKQFTAPMAYIWGIRIGLVLFVIFSFEGGLMASRLAHTVGAPDGGPGYPVVNWSRSHGDLRIAHFFGMHALQVLPVLGYFVFTNKRSIILAGFVYFVAVSVLFVRAMQGI